MQATIRDRVKTEIEDKFEPRRVVPLDAGLKNEILSTGLLVTGSGKCGKTNLVKLIARQLMNDNSLQLKLVDTVQNWVHEFGNILYQDLNEKTLAEEGFYFGDQSILFNAKILTPKDIKYTISEIVRYDYEYQWALKSEGLMDRSIIFIIEEAQNILGTIGLNDPWNTYISTGRNLNMAFIFIGRRMAQVSARARENVQGYIWGRIGGELDLDRVSRTAGDAVAATLPTLKVGEFIYYTGNKAYKIVDVPLYIPDGTTRRWLGNE